MKKVAHAIYDPKHSAGYAHETNDCAVRAMVNSFGVSYDYAHAAMKAGGRKDKAGTYNDTIDKVITAEHNGKRAVQMPGIGKAWRSAQEGRREREVTIGTFCKYHPHGQFYCIVRGHAFAVVDGMVCDSGRNRAGRRIYKAYEIV